MFLMRQILVWVVLLIGEIIFFSCIVSFYDILEPGTENIANNKEDSPDWEEDISVQWRYMLVNIAFSTVMDKLQSISDLPQ